MMPTTLTLTLDDNMTAQLLDVAANAGFEQTEPAIRAWAADVAVDGLRDKIRQLVVEQRRQVENEQRTARLAAFDTAWPAPATEDTPPAAGS